MTPPLRRVLVAGRSGQVARALLRALPEAGFEAVALGRPDLDLTDAASVAAALAAHRPDAVVNAAAWTAVDAAEADEGGAFAANALGPALLAAGCARLGAVPLLHLSTDYVFDGAKGAPYAEDDPPAPLSAYGRTKLAGEWGALAAHGRVAVLRCAWVYGAEGRNFLRAMLRLGAERDEVSVVADQLGHPTSAAELARLVAALLARIRDGGGWRAEHRGVFHAASPDWTSWHGFAAAIFAEAAALGRPAPRLRAIAAADYPTPAARPADARLDPRKLREVFGLALPPWRAPVAAAVRAALASAA